LPPWQIELFEVFARFMEARTTPPVPEQRAPSPRVPPIFPHNLAAAMEPSELQRCPIRGNFFSVAHVCVRVSALRASVRVTCWRCVARTNKLRAKIDSLGAAHNAAVVRQSPAKKSKNRIWKWRRQRALRASCACGSGRDWQMLRIPPRRPPSKRRREARPTLNHSLSASVVNKRLR
jgi:hypothetical protein